MKCKSCKADVEVRLVKDNNGNCPLCKQPAGKKYRYPARPIQKGKVKRIQKEQKTTGSLKCDYTGGKFNRDGYCSKAHLNMSNKTCSVCLKLTKKKKKKTNKANQS